MLYQNANLSQYLNPKDIKGTLPELMKRFEEAYPGSKIIYLTETGSVLHGTNSENSDTDIKGLYIPPVESYIRGDKVKILNLGKKEDEKNEADDIDLELYPVNEFFELVSKRMETNSTEILFSMFSDKTILETSESRHIRDNYKALLFNQTNAITGFAISMAARYSVKGDRLRELEETMQFFYDKEYSKKERKTISLLDIDLEPLMEGKEFVKIEPLIGKDGIEKDYLSIMNRKMILTAKVGFVIKFLEDLRASYGKRAEKARDSKGVDFKAFAHAFRAIREAKELITEGFIKFPLEYAEDLKEIKFGEGLDITELTNRMEGEKAELDGLAESSVLPEKPDFKTINEMKVAMYKDLLEGKKK